MRRLADEGIVFENAFCDVTWTIPSVASIMTGTYPFEHGVRTVLDRLSPDQVTLAELLGKAGYRTAAIVGSVAADHRFGFGQGFDTYDDEFDRAFLRKLSVPEPDDELFDGERAARLRWFNLRLHTTAYRPDEKVTDEAVEWLDSHPEEPFFLWVHFFGPHEKPNRRSRARRGSSTSLYDPAQYDRDVEAADRQVGRLLERVRRDPRDPGTAIILHSDHGQTLSEHSPPGHGVDIYDTSARVPLIVRLPGRQRAGERVSRLVRNLDIFPTALRLARVPLPPSIHGRDLLEAGVEGDELTFLETQRLTFRRLETIVADEREWKVRWAHRGLRTPGWKLVIRDPIVVEREEEGARRPSPESLREFRSIELYDLAADPLEQNNAASVEPARVAKMLGMLKTQPGAEATGDWGDLDPELRERLQSLGYAE